MAGFKKFTAGVTRDSLVKAIFVFFADISTAASIKSEKHYFKAMYSNSLLKYRFARWFPVVATLNAFV